jgi:hypothetical protein
MVANEGRIYAQIVNKKVHWIFTAADLPEWNEHDLDTVDITNVTAPAPEVGWDYDGVTFTNPAKPPPPPPTAEEIFNVAKAEFQREVQKHLDAEARACGYDNIVSACSYAGAPNPFQAEGVSFITWRGEVWAYCYAVIADIQSGARQIPTIAELLAELPARL